MCLYTTERMLFMLKGLFLDDERSPEDVTWVNYPPDMKWVVVRSHHDFIRKINTDSHFNIISFDHDIASYDFKGKEITGYDCLKWLIGKTLDDRYALPECYFHSKNPIGCNNMKQYFENIKEFLGEVK